jgi:peroxiredoxin
VVLAELEERQRKLKEEMDAEVARSLDTTRTEIETTQRQSAMFNRLLGGGPDSALLTMLEKQLRRKSRKDLAGAKRTAVDAFEDRINVVNNAVHEIQGHQAVAANEYQRGYELLKKAGQVDALYRCQIQLHFEEKEKVLTEARKYLEAHENEVQPLAMMVWLLLEAGENEQAREEFKKLCAISGSIDMQSPVFARLTVAGAVLGIEGNWRVASIPASDIGPRPDLDSLGPFRWHPSPAPDWELVDADGNTVSSKEYQGRPVLVICYLGHGCLHCAEQLQKFAPMVEEFQKAGIGMVALSTDDCAGLRVSVENYGDTHLPIRLLADPTCSVFRELRAYDEFENQPLHGTFLVDSNGLVRWQDISYEPFIKPDCCSLMRIRNGPRVTQRWRKRKLSVLAPQLTVVDYDVTTRSIRRSGNSQTSATATYRVLAPNGE